MNRNDFLTVSNRDVSESHWRFTDPPFFITMAGYRLFDSAREAKRLFLLGFSVVISDW